MYGKMISTRISDELEQLVIQYAKKHKWSKSFALGEILREYFFELTTPSDFFELTTQREVS